MANYEDQSLSQFEAENIESCTDKGLHFVEGKQPNNDEEREENETELESDDSDWVDLFPKVPTNPEIREEAPRRIAVIPAPVEEKIIEREPEDFTPEAWGRISAYVQKRKEEEKMKRIAEAEKLEMMLEGKTDKKTETVQELPKIIVPPTTQPAIKPAAPEAVKQPLNQNNRDETAAARRQPSNTTSEDISSVEIFIEFILFMLIVFTVTVALMFIQIVFYQ